MAPEAEHRCALYPEHGCRKRNFWCQHGNVSGGIQLAVKTANVPRGAAYVVKASRSVLRGMHWMHGGQTQYSRAYWLPYEHLIEYYVNKEVTLVTLLNGLKHSSLLCVWQS